MTENNRTEQMAKILAAAEQISEACRDMIEVAREGQVILFSNVGSGTTHTILADGLRLLIEATHDSDEIDDGANQLHGALIRFLEDRA